MKRILAVLLFMTVLLSACMYMPNQNEVNNSNVTTKPTSQTPSVNGEVQEMPNFMWVRSYEEYCVLLSSYKDRLPENFITYDSLSTFGEFNRFTTLKRYLDEGKLPEYNYSILTPSGEKLKIKVKEGYSASRGPIVPMERVKNGDLRSIDASGLPVDMVSIKIGEVYYIYRKGALAELRWESNGLTLILTTLNSHLKDADPWEVERGGSVFQNLFFTDTAEQAAKHIWESTNAPAVK